MTDLLYEEPASFILASKTKRFFAILIDYVLYFVFFYFFARSFGNTYTNEEGNITYRLEGLPALFFFISWFIFIPLLKGLKSQSIGKMIFGIMVVKQNGSGITMGDAIVRHLFDIVDYIPFLGVVGFIVASRNELNQRVGDLVAKTMVVQK